MKSIVTLCIIISVLRNDAFFAASSESIVKRSAIESTLSKDTGDEAPPPEQKTPPDKKTPTSTVAPEPSPSKPKTIPKAPSPSNPKAPSPSKSKSKPPAPPTSALEARQLAALQTLGVPLAKDPCSAEYISCDDAKPERHVTYLSMEYCSPQTLMTADAMDALSTLVSLSFVHCAISPLRKLPSKLADSLTSFTCTSSLGKTTEDTQMQGLSGVWLAQMRNLTKLTVTDVMVNASKVGVVVSNMKHLRDITMSRTNISGSLPKKWHPNVTYIDLSSNNISGEIPPSIGKLFHVRSLDLSSNELDGHIPSDIAKMVHLTKLSLASNKLSGPLPTSFAEMPSLEYLDLSGNTLNGSIPEYLSRLSSLRYLNLENNDFSGTMPFNASFVKRLSFFKIGGNANVCYNHSAFPSKLMLGIPVCDSSGLPAATSGPSTSKGAVSPSADAPSSSDDDEDGGPEDERGSSPPSHHHGPNKVVIGIAISLSLVFLICSCIFLSRWCSRRA